MKHFTMNQSVMNPTMMFLVLFCYSALFTHAQDTVEVEETTTELCSNGTEDSCVAFNDSEMSTASAVIEVTSTSVTTKRPKTITSAPVAKKPSPALNATVPPRPHPDCTCDVTRGGCEVNCCCDVDCTAEQRAVFTRCVATPQAVDSDHCFPPQLLYRNNTDYQTVETEPGVLCVVEQNTLASTDFVDVPVIRTVAALEKKLGRRRGYSWPNPPPSPPLFDADTMYGDGSPIWISNNSTINHLVLPAPVGYSTECHSTLMPRYLEEMVTSCTVPLTTKSDCLSSKEMRFSVISSPGNFNFTQPQECTEDICLPVHHYICSKSCSEVMIPRPAFNGSSDTCENLTTSVEYKIYHNGSQGILDVKAFYILQNISVHADQRFRKHFKVSYEWAHTTDRPVLQRSGRPGYETGKPVISGRRTVKGVVFGSSAADWISVGGSGSSGFCLTRHSLLFRENLQTQCLLNVNGTCKQMQQQIWQQVLGAAANLSEVMISGYGDPRGDEEGAWVPVLMGDLPPPSGALTTVVDIIVVYSLVGSVARPQAKIIGAYLHSVPSGATCSSNRTTVVIETSVKFIDKTTPAVTKFAQPPVYEIKLPQDFFYPFLSIGNRNHFTSNIVLLITALVYLR